MATLELSGVEVAWLELVDVALGKVKIATNGVDADDEDKDKDPANESLRAVELLVRLTAEL